VARASSRVPVSRYGTEYKVRPTSACASGATLGRVQVAGSNGPSGSRSNAPASSAANTSATVRPSKRPGPALPGDLHAPGLRIGGHRRQRGPAAPGEEAGPDVPLVRLDRGLIPHRQLRLIRAIGTGASG
jgi:hypothetical protein